MIPKAREVRLKPKVRKVLEARCRAPTTAQRDVKRARIVLLAAEGRSTRSIAAEVVVQPRIVSNWRRRFAEHGLGGLKDRPRAGKKPMYGKATNKRILVLLEKPPPAGYARWTGPLLAKALGDVDVQYVWRFLREHNIDLAAPGYVFTTYTGGGYGYAAGTSYSAPVVAGVAGLVISANPRLTGAQVRDILKQSADDLGPVGWDSTYGWGRVNANRAVTMAMGGGSTTDTTPPSVSFNSPSSGATVSGPVSISVGASDNVGVSTVSLSIDGGSFATDAAAPYNFSWDTSAAANGNHTLSATATDAAGNATTTSITVTVNNVVDRIAPVVIITSPVNGGTVSGMVSITVNATDAVGVIKVESYVDGVLNAVSSSAPFTTKWNSRKASRGPHLIQAKAYDRAGNVGVSTVCQVSR